MIWVPVLVFGFIGFLAGIAVFGLLIQEEELEPKPAKKTVNGYDDPHSLASSKASFETSETDAPIAALTPQSQSSKVLSLSAPTDRAKNLLSAQLAHWGYSGQTTMIFQLRSYLQHDDADIRSQAAVAIAQIVSRTSPRQEVLATIPNLGGLIRDRVPAVRQAAVMALGEIRGQTAKIWLQQAIHDPDLKVSSAARQALARFAYDPQPIKCLNFSSKLCTSLKAKQRSR